MKITTRIYVCNLYASPLTPTSFPLTPTSDNNSRVSYIISFGLDHMQVLQAAPTPQVQGTRVHYYFFS
jgi:hypothetical protein